nr:PREDICTED: treacle protein isoform X1 [Anolis carolinensis]|eukprot:XP_008103027.1 PREDICTED: treacle protein isoform X1 [Anolis carolinensis]
MARGGGESKELLALVHQHLLQAGFARAAKELLEESGQKTFSSSPVPLREIFTQWKKSQPQKRKAGAGKREPPAKIRVPDPKSSSESSDEEVISTTKANVPANNSSVAKADRSSEDEDSSSEEETVAAKVVKTPVTGNRQTDFLQLAAQKTNSFPGKGVAVASVQAKGRQSKASLNKPLSPVVAKAGQNKVPSSKQGLAAQSPAQQGPKKTQVATAKVTVVSESGSSSSSSEAEEENTPSVVKTPPTPKTDLKKAESSSEDSSEDSDSEDGGGVAAAKTKAATVQPKPSVQSPLGETTLAKNLPTSTVPSKGHSVKVSTAKTPENQIRTEIGNTAQSTKPAESSETSDSSESGEDEEPRPLTQTKSPRKTPQAATAVVKNAPLSTPSSKVSVSSPMKQTPKPSAAKLRTPSKKAESSESSESSSESEEETHPIPVSQKRLQTPPHPAGAKQIQADKGKEAVNESSSSSDSEDETVPMALKSPPRPATKASTPAQPAGATKPVSGSLQKAQQSEDSSQDSSDESDSEEDTVYTQKPSQVSQKPVSTPVKAVTAKSASVTVNKPGNSQPGGKGTASPAKPVAVCLQKASGSSETDSSDSSDSKTAAKTTKQPPIHPFFKQVASKAIAASPKGPQVSSSPSLAPVTKRKVEQNSSKKARLSQGQALPVKPSGPLESKESSGSSTSSDSEEEEEKKAAKPSATAKQIPQPGIAQKRGIKKKDSSSEESSDEDQKPSQSLLAGSSTPFKTTTSPVLLSKQSPAKAGNLGISEKSAIADSSSSDSSDSNTDAEVAIAQKAETSSLPASGKEAIVAKETAGKGATAGKKGPGRDSSKASATKKATAKTQSNGKAKETLAAKLPVTSLFKANPTDVSSKSNEGPVAQVPGTGALDNTDGATPVVDIKTPKETKAPKSGEKKKPSKKRKLATGETVSGEPKEKKLKEENILDMLTKKKKKKKSKSSDNTKLAKKDGKEKKSDKKKKKSKKMESISKDGLQKKKKKKKKIGNLEGAA